MVHYLVLGSLSVVPRHWSEYVSCVCVWVGGCVCVRLTVCEVCVCEANCVGGGNKLITEPTVKRLIKAPSKTKFLFGAQKLIERRQIHQPQLFRMTTR